MSLHYRPGLFFLVSSIGCALGEICYYYRSNDFLDSKYCAYGCCGNYNNQYCCVNVWPILGGGIIILIFIGITITIMSCLYCPCCQPTRRSLTGILFRTNPNPTMTTVEVQQPGYVQPYAIQSAGSQSMQTQPSAENCYVQYEAKAVYPTGPATYQAA